MADDELNLQVTLDDQATAQIAAIRAQLMRLGGGTSGFSELRQQTREMTTLLRPLAQGSLSVRNALHISGQQLGATGVAAAGLVLTFQRQIEQFKIFSDQVDEATAQAAALGIRAPVYDDMVRQLRSRGANDQTARSSIAGFTKSIAALSREGSELRQKLSGFAITHPQAMTDWITRMTGYANDGQMHESWNEFWRGINFQYQKEFERTKSELQAREQTRMIVRQFNVDPAMFDKMRIPLEGLKAENEERFGRRRDVAKQYQQQHQRLHREYVAIQRRFNTALLGPFTAVNKFFADNTVNAKEWGTTIGKDIAGIIEGITRIGVSIKNAVQWFNSLKDKTAAEAIQEAGTAIAETTVETVKEIIEESKIRNEVDQPATGSTGFGGWLQGRGAALGRALGNASVGIRQLATGQDLTPRQQGGPVTGGQPYLVGEQGPEIFVPQGSGTILSNTATMSMGGGRQAREHEFVIQRSVEALEGETTQTSNVNSELVTLNNYLRGERAEAAGGPGFLNRVFGARVIGMRIGRGGGGGGGGGDIPFPVPESSGIVGGSAGGGGATGDFMPSGAPTGVPTGGGTAGEEIKDPRTIIALARTQLGWSRIRNRAELEKFFKDNGIRASQVSVAYCAEFVNAHLNAQGIKGTGSAAAGSYTKYGTAVQNNDVLPGDIGVVKGRSPRTGLEGKHVGFLTGEKRIHNGKLQLKMIGGNQGGGAVRESWYYADQLHQRRIPGRSDQDLQVGAATPNLGGGDQPGTAAMQLGQPEGLPQSIHIPSTTSSALRTSNVARSSGEGGYSVLAEQRAAFGAEVQNNPALRERWAALMYAENAKAPQHVGESMVNRASAWNTSLAHQIDPTSSSQAYKYYEPYQKGGGAYSRALSKVRNDPATRARLFEAQDKILGGSNLANLGTHNASAGVAARARRDQTITAEAGGETYSRKDIPGTRHGAGIIRKEKSWFERTSAAMRAGDLERDEVDSSLSREAIKPKPVVTVDVNVKASSDTRVQADGNGSIKTKTTKQDKPAAKKEEESEPEREAA